MGSFSLMKSSTCATHLAIAKTSPAAFYTFSSPCMAWSRLGIAGIKSLSAFSMLSDSRSARSIKPCSTNATRTSRQVSSSQSMWMIAPSPARVSLPSRISRADSVSTSRSPTWASSIGCLESKFIVIGLVRLCICHSACTSTPSFTIMGSRMQNQSRLHSIPKFDLPSNRPQRMWLNSRSCAMCPTARLLAHSTGSHLPHTQTLCLQCQQWQGSLRTPAWHTGTL